MNICSFCQREVLESKTCWGYHHSSEAEFQDAADSGCVFCARLAVPLEDLQPWFDNGNVNNTAALYRWNIRQAASNRETTSYISITFRPVPGRMVGEENSEDLPEVRFDLFPEKDLGALPDKKSLGLTTSSVSSLSQMERWLRDCSANHPKCTKRHGTQDFIPTRVLDVGLPGGVWPPSHVPVVETDKKGVIGPYMTLSHRWGENDFVQLKKSNFDRFTGNGDNEGIPWDEICSNRNFEEALKLTHDLRQRYIWIDSVCIIQDDPKDWAVEARRMHKVYRNSFCNLAAAVSEASTRGLFRQRSSDIAPVSYTARGFSPRFGDRSWIVFPSDLWNKDLLESRLYTRGWVFQERMLSPRLLQFCHDQIFWDCATISACETLPYGLPLSLDTTASIDRYWRLRLQDSTVAVDMLVNTSESSLERFWERAVRTYTSCDITKFTTDRDAAIWGIAKLVRDALGEEYAHGLWSRRIGEQLLWRVASRRVVRRPEDLENRSPFWSWIRMKGTIQLPPRFLGFPDQHHFYAATNHEGGSIKFQFRNVLWGRVKREAKSKWSEEVAIMNKKLDDLGTARATVPVTPIPQDHPEASTELSQTKKRTVEGTSIAHAETALAVMLYCGLVWVRGVIYTLFYWFLHWMYQTEVEGTDDPDIGGRTNPDKPSQLTSTNILVQGHICKGGIRAAAEEQTWEFVIDGVNRETAVIEAYPDFQPSQKEATGESEFLLLAATKVYIDEHGIKWADVQHLEDEEVNDMRVEYGGSGILVERVEESPDCLRRVGVVAFRQLDRQDWCCFRKACGDEQDVTRSELDVGRGKKVWLV